MAFENVGTDNEQVHDDDAWQTGVLAVLRDQRNRIHDVSLQLEAFAEVLEERLPGFGEAYEKAYRRIRKLYAS